MQPLGKLHEDGIPESLLGRPLAIGGGSCHVCPLDGFLEVEPPEPRIQTDLRDDLDPSSEKPFPHPQSRGTTRQGLFPTPPRVVLRPAHRISPSF